MNKNRLWSIKEILWWVFGLLVFFAISGFVLVQSSKPQPPAIGEVFPILESKHISIGGTHPTYNSNPPTSGEHYVDPADWNVYETELPDEQLVHNIEHGGIWISYKNIDQNTKSKLEALTRQNFGSVIMTPRAKNDASIVFASWGRLEKFESFDEKAMTLFIKANKNRSPEPLAR
jgi:hypothetical protein